MVTSRHPRRAPVHEVTLAQLTVAAALLATPALSLATPPTPAGPAPTNAASAGAAASSSAEPVATAAPASAAAAAPTSTLAPATDTAASSTTAAPATDTAAPSTTAAPATAAGPARTFLPRPSTPAARACSFTAPVCVHAPSTVPAWSARAALRAAESALSAYRALKLPMPLADATRGGTSAYDVYLTDGEGPGVTTPDLETEPRPTDQTAAYTLLPAPSTWGCDLSFDVARHAAEAILFRLDAGAERGMVAAASSYLASIVAPCAARETPAIDAFQAAPYRAITELPFAPEASAAASLAASPAPSPPASYASGALLFPMFLEEQAGTGDPGQLVTSLFAIASQKSDPAALHWQNEPDTFDALRSTLRVQRASVDTLLLDFAVDRAFVGDRSDGAHLPSTDLYGAAGRVFFEWSIPYATLPRRVAPLHPLEPTGAAYVWLDLAGAPKHAEVTFVADWELPCVFRWSLVKVDKSGAESGRIDVAGIVGATHVERTLVLGDDLAGVIIVGTNGGSLDRTQPFDPDDAPFLPHAYEITLYGKIESTPFVQGVPSGP